MPPKDDPMKYVAMAVAKGPKIALKLGWQYLRIKKRAQRAEKVFRKKLLAAGLEKETAERLAERYASTVRLKELLRTIGVPGSAMGNGRR